MFSFIELHCGFHSMFKAVLYENLQGACRFQTMRSRVPSIKLI